jgi:hypothetical protein
MMDMNLEQQVRVRAYELWIRDGMTHGRDSEHWRTAECEVLAEHAAVGKPKRKAKGGKSKK